MSLVENLGESRTALDAVREELISLQARMTELEKTAVEFEKTKKRIANIELKAYERADEIEKQAVHNSEVLRQSIRESAMKSAKQYNQVRVETESTAVHIAKELEQMREWLLSFGSLFSGLDSVYDEIENQNADDASAYVGKKMPDEGEVI